MGQSRKLADDLASRLRVVIPRTLTVRAIASSVCIYDDERELGGSAAASIVDDIDDRSDAERLESAVRATLSGIQDVISEALREQWPPRPDLSMAFPEVRREAGHLHLWFGDEHAPVLQLQPLEIAAYAV